MILLIIMFLLGVAAGMITLWRILPARYRQHVDYRQRWEDAIGLLGSEGQLTQEQVNQVTGVTPPVVKRQPASTLSTLHSMASWDRKDLEVARARKGLDPLDDLAGMATWDKKAVLKARMEGK